MQINIKSTNLGLTPEVKDYIEKKVLSLEKFLNPESEDAATALFEIAQKSGQKSGDIFHADCLIQHLGDKFYASADKEDIYKAVDTVREELARVIKRTKSKRLAVFHRGARKVKDMMKTVASYRPWRK